MKTYALWLTIVVVAATNADAKEWSDSTGNYSITGDMIAFSDSTVVLKKKNSDLVAVPLKKLSKRDQEWCLPSHHPQDRGAFHRRRNRW